MKYALFLGCKIPYHVPHYEIATRRVLGELGVELVDLEFPCCGYPMRHLYFRSFLLSAARGLALAEVRGLDITTPCKCCFGALKRAQKFLDDNPELRREVNAELAAEGLHYQGRVKVRHILQVLHHDVGLAELQRRVVRPYELLRAAILYGCHAMRPSDVTRFDDPVHPHLIDDLVGVTGATPVDWAGRLSCCGAPLRERNQELALATIRRRLGEAGEARAHILVLACVYSQMQAEWAYSLAGPPPQRELIEGPVLYPQLLGLAMGLTAREVALERNTPNGEYLISFLRRD